MGRLKTHAEFLSQLEQYPFTAKAEYQGNHTNIKFLCHQCNQVITKTPGSIFQGHGCQLCKSQNLIIEERNDWLLIDISTPNQPGATMAIDKDFWMMRKGLRVYAHKSRTCDYIYAVYHDSKHRHRQLHRDVIDIPASFDCDHKKHGGMLFVDNRRSNLRIASRAQNIQNQSIRKDNKSSAKGVIWRKDMEKWSAQITFNKKQRHLGCFINIEDAIAARKKAEKRYFGEYAFNANNK